MEALLGGSRHELALLPAHLRLRRLRGRRRGRLAALGLGLRRRGALEAHAERHLELLVLLPIPHWSSSHRTLAGSIHPQTLGRGLKLRPLSDAPSKEQGSETTRRWNLGTAHRDPGSGGG
uniref:Uncharacterized protein n=1 Tax=Arundo donax TaxID=35708 RepID=A0A0A9DNQ0_ARUDO